MLIFRKSAIYIVGLKGIVPYFLTNSALENDGWACLFLEWESESNSHLQCPAQMGKRQFFVQKHEYLISLGVLLMGQAFHCLLWTEVAFFNLNLLSIFLLWGRVGREDGIIAEKKAHLFILSCLEAGPPYVRFSFGGEDCGLQSNFMNVGRVSGGFYSIRSSRRNWRRGD